MPVDMARYPQNWETEIRPFILARANNKCEWCGVKNHVNIWRHPHEDCSHIIGTMHDGIRWYGKHAYMEHAVYVRLTIAHIHDPNPANCDFDNLAALCEACHNRHDARMRVMNKIRSKNKKLEALGQLRMF